MLKNNRSNDACARLNNDAGRLFFTEQSAGQLANRVNVIWLILPVVICLSQRLSHACLSISTCTVKLRMAH